MRELVVARYLIFEDFVSDLVRLEKVIEKWKEEHPGYDADTVAEIDEVDIYSITVLCKSPCRK